MPVDKIPAKSLRIERGARRARAVTITVDGRATAAQSGDSVAAAMLAAGEPIFRTSPRAGTPRGPFCFMGSCQECVVRIDGVIVPACGVPVSDGLVVERVAIDDR
ncbi:MAG: (2Fe-2S)-binding protein [Alphaproteobacteria bacterium]|nr:(2Fe-2S)-binding protein [Alphaproteobacteria bacterium]